MAVAWESWYSTDTRRIYLGIFVFQYLRIFVFSSLDKMAFSLRKLELNWQQANVLSTQGAIKVSLLNISWRYQCLKYQYISIKESQGNNSFFWNFVWNFCNNSIWIENDRKSYGWYPRSQIPKFMSKIIIASEDGGKDGWKNDWEHCPNLDAKKSKINLSWWWNNNDFISKRNLAISSVLWFWFRLNIHMSRRLHHNWWHFLQ